jgi:hypothetical protein
MSITKAADISIHAVFPVSIAIQEFLKAVPNPCFSILFLEIL